MESPGLAGLGLEDENCAVTVTAASPGNFILTFADCALGFIDWDNEVENLDPKAFRCRRPSQRLRWREVMITTTECAAPSAERLREALRHVVVLYVLSN